MSKKQFNLCDWCNPKPDIREPYDFIYYFTTLFGKRIEYPSNTRFNEEDLINAVENATVKDVMQSLTYLYDHYKNDKELIKRMYEQLVFRRDLWYSLPHNINNKKKINKTIKVSEITPWRYFHDILRRKDYCDYKYELINYKNSRYLIWIEYIQNKKKFIEELGIVDEHYLYYKCDCNFNNVKVLCSRCNSYIKNNQCLYDESHKYSSLNIRCFRIDHGRIKPQLNNDDYIDENIQVNIKHFDRFEKNRKSSRIKKSPKISPVLEQPPSYQEFEEKRKSPEIVHENKFTHENEIPESLKNPYDKQNEVPPIPERRSSPKEENQPIIKPPARVIPVYDLPFEEPPPTHLPDEIHSRPTEGSTSPIPRLPTPEGEKEDDLINRKPLISLRDKPLNLPEKKETTPPPRSPVKLREIPVHRESPLQPNRLSDVEKYHPINVQPDSYDYPPESPKVKTDIPLLPPRDDIDYNILLVGPVGSGKSTWINSLSNYLRYDTLDDAKIHELFTVIPTKFNIYDDLFNEYIITHGNLTNDELNTQLGETVTKIPKQYKFRTGKNTVNIIDTPGINDIRGILQDELNLNLIIDELKNLKLNNINNIVIFIKANETRIDTSLEQSLITLFSRFPKSVIKNLTFFFTFSRLTMFEIGNIYNSLTKFFNQIEQNHHVKITFTSDTIYTMDNESFRYLVVSSKNDKKLLEKCMNKYNDYEYSWHKSQHESARFFDHLNHINSINTHDIIIYNQIKNISHELAKIIINSDNNDTEAFKMAYEIVLDYLIQNSIIITDPLMREIIKSKKEIPYNLDKKYFVDHRTITTEIITKETVYRYIYQFKDVKHLSYDFMKCIDEYIKTYEEHENITNTSNINIRYSPNQENRETFSELRLSHGPGETTYSCLEERRTVITEKVHYFDSRPGSIVGGTSIQSTV